MIRMRSTLLAWPLYYRKAEENRKGGSHEKLFDQQEPVLLLLAQKKDRKKAGPSGGQHHRKGHPHLWKGPYPLREIERREQPMKRSRPFAPIILALTLFTTGLLGCAHAPKIEPPTLSEEDKSQLGTIGVVSASFQPEFTSQKPMTKGNAAKAAAGAGARGCLRTGGSVLGAVPGGGDPFAGAVVAAVGLGIIVLTPVGAAVGGIVGAVRGVNEAAINDAESTLNLALNEIDLQKTLRDRVLSVAQEKTSYIFTPLDDKGPSFLNEEVSYLSRIQAGVETILELSVLQFGLSSTSDGPGINPPLTLFMAANVRVVRISDDKVLYNYAFRYENEEKKKFTKWAEKQGQPLKDELNRCLDSLANQIVTVVFGLQGT